MAARYGVGALEMTTAEIFEDLKGSDIPEDLYREMKTLFERADFVKFAKFTATDEENAQVLPQAVRFVTSTYQAGACRPRRRKREEKQCSLSIPSSLAAGYPGAPGAPVPLDRAEGPAAASAGIRPWMPGRPEDARSWNGSGTCPLCSNRRPGAPCDGHRPARALPRRWRKWTRKASTLSLRWT